MFTTGNWFDATVGNHRGQWDRPPSLPAQALPPGRVGQAYSYQMLGEGDFSASGLPSGLAVSTAGLITGTPSAVASAQVTFTAAIGGRSVVRVIPLAVTADAAQAAVTTTSLTTATVGVAGSQQLTFSGAGTITATATGLPSGAGMSSGGLITWDTSVATGTYTVVVTPTSSTTGAGAPRIFQWLVLAGDTLDPGAWAPHLRTRRG